MSASEAAMVDVSERELVNEGVSATRTGIVMYTRETGRAEAKTRERPKRNRSWSSSAHVDGIRLGRTRGGGYARERRVILVRVSKSECNNAHSSTPQCRNATLLHEGEDEEVSRRRIDESRRLEEKTCFILA